MFLSNFNTKTSPGIFHQRNEYKKTSAFCLAFIVTLLWVDFSGYLVLNYFVFWFTIKPLHKQCGSKDISHLKNICLARYLTTVNKVFDYSITHTTKSWKLASTRFQKDDQKGKRRYICSYFHLEIPPLFWKINK